MKTKNITDGCQPGNTTITTTETQGIECSKALKLCAGVGEYNSCMHRDGKNKQQKDWRLATVCTDGPDETMLYNRLIFNLRDVSLSY